MPHPLPTVGNILPRVVHRDYFNAAGVGDIDSATERFGIVKPIGNDLYAFLAVADGELIRNVHTEDLTSLGISEASAWDTATGNYRTMAFDGQSVEHRIMRANDGNDWAVWLGNDLTSSSILLPDLYSWSHTNLSGNGFLVCVASTQLVFILPQSLADDLDHFDKYIAGVVEGSDNLVSDKWFSVTESNTVPFVASQ